MHPETSQQSLHGDYMHVGTYSQSKSFPAQKFTTLRLKKEKENRNAKIHHKKRRMYPTPTGCSMYWNFISSSPSLSITLLSPWQLKELVSGIISFSLFKSAIWLWNTPLKKLPWDLEQVGGGGGQACCSKHRGIFPIETDPVKLRMEGRSKLSRGPRGKQFIKIKIFHRSFLLKSFHAVNNL